MHRLPANNRPKDEQLTLARAAGEGEPPAERVVGEGERPHIPRYKSKARLARGLSVVFPPLVLALLSCSSAPPQPTPEARAEAVAAFATVQQVFQHPRCQNCHIPGDAPLQFDEGRPHAQGVVRGPDGHGAPGLPCATCHADRNPPASYGPHAPPGAPHWALPPPHMKMVTIGLSPQELCRDIQDKSKNGGRDFPALIKHVAEDKLVLWGWNPGGTRAPVPVPHEQFVAAFKTWAAAGGPCPGEGVQARR